VDDTRGDIYISDVAAWGVCWRFVCRRRERLVKFLRSNQVQTFLCSIVLVDACVIVAQILLDINSVKGKFTLYSFSVAALRCGKAVQMH